MTTAGNSDEQPLSPKSSSSGWIFIGAIVSKPEHPHATCGTRTHRVPRMMVIAPSTWTTSHATVRYSRVTAHAHNVIICDGGVWSTVRVVVSFTDSFRACQPMVKLRDVLAQSAADGSATSKEGCRIPKPARLLLLHSPSAACCRSYHSVVCRQEPVSRACLASIRVG